MIAYEPMFRMYSRARRWDRASGYLFLFVAAGSALLGSIAATVAMAEDVTSPAPLIIGGVALLPPATAVVTGHWEARALVIDPAIVEVAFFLDGDLVTKAGKRRLVATLPLADEPTEYEARIEGYGRDGALLASDQLTLNPPSCTAGHQRSLYVTVTDRRSKPISGLTADDFQVRRGSEQLEIVGYEKADPLPLTLGLALDTSGSMFKTLAEVRRATAALLDSVVRPGDRCFAIAFNDRPFLLAPPTATPREVAERLRQMVALGSTSVYDAVATSLLVHGQGGRRVLLLVSGADNSSRLRFTDALEYARRAGVVIYAVGLGIFDRSARRKLEQLARETGGRFLNVDKAADLPYAYTDVVTELRSQYLLTYNGDPLQVESGSKGEVKVEVRRASLKVRTMRAGCPPSSPR